MTISYFKFLVIFTIGIWLGVFGIELDLKKRITPKFIMGGLIWTMAVSSLLVVMIPRLSLDQVVPGELPASIPGDFRNASHIVNALFLIFLVLGIIYNLNHRARRRNGTSIAITTILFSAAFFLSAFFGSVPSFTWKLIIWPVSILVVYFLPRIPMRWVMRQLHYFLMIIIFGSILTALIIPHWAIDGTMNLSSFLHRTSHLQGLTQQYDGLAIESLLGAITSYSIKDLKFRRTCLTFSIVSLILSGARTSEIALLICFAVLWAYSGTGSKTLRLVSASFAGLFAALATLYVVMVGIFGSSGYGQGLATLNGRTLVWAITIDQWRQSPLVGYGLTLWSAPYRSSHDISNLTWVGMAHNQFIQSLGETGLVGLISLVIFLVALTQQAFRNRLHDCGVSLTLTIALFIIMITEVPLTMGQLPTPLIPTIAVILVTLSAQPSNRTIEKPNDEKARERNFGFEKAILK